MISGFSFPESPDDRFSRFVTSAVHFGREA